MIKKELCMLFCNIYDVGAYNEYTNNIANISFQCKSNILYTIS